MRVISEMIEYLVNERWLSSQQVARLRELGFYPALEADEDTEPGAELAREDKGTIWEAEQEQLEITAMSEARERMVARNLAWTRRGRRLAASRTRAA